MRFARRSKDEGEKDERMRGEQKKDARKKDEEKTGEQKIGGEKKDEKKNNIGFNYLHKELSKKIE